jgi:hypothetical protein
MSETLTIGTPNLANDLTLAPQVRKILAHLLTGKTITNNESMLVYHVSRLSDVVLKLRRAGYDIQMTMKVDGIGVLQAGEDTRRLLQATAASANGLRIRLHLDRLRNVGGQGGVRARGAFSIFVVLFVARDVWRISSKTEAQWGVLLRARAPADSLRTRSLHTTTTVACGALAAMSLTSSSTQERSAR